MNRPPPFRASELLQPSRQILGKLDARAILSIVVILDGGQLCPAPSEVVVDLSRAKDQPPGGCGTWTVDNRLRPLSSKGDLQAIGLAKTLMDRRVEAIFTSPYLRCVQTVTPLAKATGLEIVEHPALSEGEGGKATRGLL